MVYIIAEAGVNHNGSLKLAYQMVDIAKSCGADAIKFQSFKCNLLATKDCDCSSYQGKGKQYDMLKKLQLNIDEFKILANYCKLKEIDFMCTPFDIESVHMLKELNVDYIKVGSGDLTNYLLLKEIGKTKIKTILSTGMSTFLEVTNAVKFIKDHGCPEVIILHCISSYPTKPEECNLNCIKKLKLHFNKVGFSDHTTGTNSSIISIALGATYIEKHFTIDKSLEGPDHSMSLDPTELEQFIKTLRLVPIMLGNGTKRCMPSEEENRRLVRRSVAINKDLKKGHKLTSNDVIALRPNTGIPCNLYCTVLGKVLKYDKSKYTLIKKEDIM